MNLSKLPLNGLRAFYVSAKHQNFTKSANELCVTQTAVSQQVKKLEECLGVTLFNRMPRGINLTEEGMRLFPIVEKAFSHLSLNLDNLQAGCPKHVVNLGVVGTFALHWLLPRLEQFHQECPTIELRISTNNNRSDAFAEGLDYVIRFGNGNWNNSSAIKLFDAPFTVLCNQRFYQNLKSPIDVLQYPLLRSYDVTEWDHWLIEAGAPPESARRPTVTFDSTSLMVDAAIQGYGLALAPPLMFAQKIFRGQLAQPFDIYLNKGGYWLSRLDIKKETTVMEIVKQWLIEQAKETTPHKLNKVHRK
ncbi:LysR family transcriptional regulator [Vibrio sagamiensis]|uniref:LysR family transcriptional regulator n=1 Tax=Vibrio sagamiensis NBRC 104589 TaxID=1219064 RepID=A0A511QCQ4_9VIBR|nr:LysR family transcriptional regulator [Vibrio sagamiensis]PNQ53716.1 LysR family transcriptional regulator [Vibrio agarivorans]GEM75071.1 LysR family transcriptional regulator [Vibrio sagamiensis NBRC 104589]